MTEEKPEIKKQIEKQFCLIFHVKNLKELKEKYKTIEPVNMPITKMFFEKKAFTKLVNELGLDSNNEEFYGAKLQTIK